MQTATGIKPYEKPSPISLCWKIVIGIGKGIVINEMIFVYLNYLAYPTYKYKRNFLHHENIKNRS